MGETFLITGATGGTSGLVLAALRARGANVRALVRDETKASRLADLGATLVLGDFNDPSSLARAIEGVTSVFLLTPPRQDDLTMVERFLAASTESRARPRVVRLSAIKACEGGPTESSRSHGRIDSALVNSGLPYTILRPSFFMQNFLGSAETIAATGALVQGAGEGRIGFIDVRDIADVATAVLLDRSWDRGIYDLTGPATLSFHEVARELGAALARDVKYTPVTPEQIRKSIVDMGWGDWSANLMADYSRAYASGWGDFTTSFVEKITGNAPRTLADFAREVFAPKVRG